MQSIGLQITVGVEPQAKPEASGYSPRAFTMPEWVRYRAGILNSDIALETFVFLTRTLAAGASEELILNNGSLADPTTAAVTFVNLKAVAVIVTDGDVGVRVGNAGTNPNALWFGGTTHTWDVLAGGPPLVGGGSTVTVDGTHCRVKVANLDGAAAVEYQILLAGEV